MCRASEIAIDVGTPADPDEDRCRPIRTGHAETHVGVEQVDDPARRSGLGREAQILRRDRNGRGADRIESHLEVAVGISLRRGDDAEAHPGNQGPQRRERQQTSDHQRGTATLSDRSPFPGRSAPCLCLCHHVLLAVSSYGAVSIVAPFDNRVVPCADTFALHSRWTGPPVLSYKCEQWVATVPACPI
jgi:hypothetical protein